MQPLELDPSCYRTRFFLGLVRSLSPPIALTWLALKCVGLHTSSTALRLLAYALAMCVWTSLKSWYHNWSSDRRARVLGATPIPRVIGKWPGNVDIMLRIARDLRQGYTLQAMSELLDEYNCDTLNMRILWKDSIITRDDIHMRTMHATHFYSFERGAEQAEKMGTFLGKGIFVTDGEKWKTNRAMIRPFLSKERVTDVEIISEHAERAVGIMNETSASGQPIDIQDLFSRFTLDSGADFLLGMKTESLASPRPEPFRAGLGAKGAATADQYGTFARAFEEVQVTISMRWRLGALFPLYELFGDRTLPHVAIVTQWVKPVVVDALKRKLEGSVQHQRVIQAERTLLDSLLEHTDDEETVRFGLLNVLMAARDTTAAFLSFTTYLLTMHPEVFQRLRNEVLDVCGPSGIPVSERVQQMPYLNAVLNESLRLFPPAPMGIRNSVEEVLFPMSDGSPPLYVPAKARVSWLILPLHRRYDLWGTDADQFDPERWLDERQERQRVRPWMYIPFLSGPRNCPGQNFALQEASFLITRIAQSFSRIDLVPEALPSGGVPPAEWKNGKGRQRIEKCWPSTAFTAFIKGGLWVRFVK